MSRPSYHPWWVPAMWLAVHVWVWFSPPNRFALAVTAFAFGMTLFDFLEGVDQRAAERAERDMEKFRADWDAEVERINARGRK